MEQQSEYRVSERFKNRLDEREGMPKAPNSDSVGDCPKRDNTEACGTLLQEPDKIPETYSNEDIERRWQHIETSLAILRNLHIERANMEFWSRFEMITKGMTNR